MYELEVIEGSYKTTSTASILTTPTPQPLPQPQCVAYSLRNSRRAFAFLSSGHTELELFQQEASIVPEASALNAEDQAPSPLHLLLWREILCYPQGRLLQMLSGNIITKKKKKKKKKKNVATPLL